MQDVEPTPEGDGPRKIVIVEDEADVFELLSYHLNKAGFETVWADNGALGLELIRQIRPVAVILDVMLPRLSGFEVCRTLKLDEGLRTIPVLILTARTQVADKLFGFECGAHHYLTKPFHPREVVAWVKDLPANRFCLGGGVESPSPCLEGASSDLVAT